MKLDNLAVIFIGTDKYLKFLPSRYQTCEEKLVPNIPKQYFVFTDGQLEGTPVSYTHLTLPTTPYV